MINMNIIVFLQIIIVITLFIFIILLLRQSIANRKARRIGYYSLDPINNNALSFSDKLVTKYLNFVKNMRHVIKRVEYLERRSKG